ncbi:MAG: hypothetical protein CHACPFDD_02992 [Phycisphaerae bacterium]|nr:hypothetical protein [Phycisphaerae bacterium]
MWPFTRRSLRRREIHRSKIEQRLPLYRRFFARIGAGPIALTLIFGLVAAALVNLRSGAVPLRPGMYIAHGFVSRVPFSIEDKQLTAIRRMQARDSSPACYQADNALLDEIRARLTQALKRAQSVAENQPAEGEPALDAAAVSELKRLGDSVAPGEFEKFLDQVVAGLATVPLVETAEQRDRLPIEARLAGPDAERSSPISGLLSTRTPEVANRAADAAARTAPAGLRELARSVSLQVLVLPDGAVRPLYRVDADRTRQLSHDAEERVQTQFLTFKENALLANAGVLDDKELELLRAEQAAFETLAEKDPALSLRVVATWIGRGLLAFMVAAGVVLYVSRDKNRRSDLRRLSGAVVVLSAMTALARVLTVYTNTLPGGATAGAFAFAVAVIAIIYPRWLAFGAAGGVAVLTTLVADQDIGFLAMLLSAAAVLVVGLSDIRSRGRIVVVGLAAGAAAFVMSVAKCLVGHESLHFSLWFGGWAGGTVLGAAIVVEGLMPFIERLLRLSTSMTLLEWCDANKPLLRMLATRAPGTYNHSLLLGSMAESAADAIGANGLLARAGAYYHDIGKINKPDYFIENQSPGTNRHEGLSPAMSLLIIVSHVKDGIEIAREYGLPQSLHPFIAEHHGTTLVEYFYHAAHRRRRPDDPEIADTQFRYPGPKPQTRETAIVMLCDGVEGAVRAMADPTPARIETLVDQIVRKRLVDGQLDSCDMTFREMESIQQSLVKSLCGIYHGRITYPAPQERSA